MNDGSVQTTSVPPWLDGVQGDWLPALIMSDAPLVRVNAGPGSGKTEGLKRRVQRLILDKQVEPQRIFVGTFTRAITSELTESLGNQVANGVTVLTLHSLAYKLLRENPVALAGRKLRFLLKHELEPMLYDIGGSLSNSSTQFERVRLLRKLQSDWAQKRELGEAEFAGELDRWLRLHHAMMIDEVVPLATRALANNDVPGNQFDEVIVDEYQDLTRCEQDLVERVWSQNGSLIVLGDNDQSIYGFRDNHPLGIEEFSKRWEGKEILEINLPDNYRSARDIVGASNTLMAEAMSSKVPMVPQQPIDGTALRLYWPTLDDEAAGLAEYLKRRSDTSFLVLVPLRILGYRIESAVGPDARTAFSEEVLESPLLQERFTLATLLANPNDKAALRSWLGFKGSVPEQSPQRNAEAYAVLINLGAPSLSLLRQIVENQVTISGLGSTHLKERAKRLLIFLEQAPESPEDQINWLFDPDQAIEIADEEKQRWARLDLMALRDTALDMIKGDQPNLQAIVQELRYKIATRVPLAHETVEPPVRIMTLHSAKGLEAETVIVAGLADQIVPGKSTDPADREEKRRLLYVAVTRARSELLISWAQKISYDDAASNYVRIDPGSIQTIAGNKHVRLSSSSLIPSDFPGPIRNGRLWLAAGK